MLLVSGDVHVGSACQPHEQLGAVTESLAQVLRPLELGACMARSQLGLITDVLGDALMGVLPPLVPHGEFRLQARDPLADVRDGV